MPTATLDRLIVDYLVANAPPGVFTLGTNLFRGPYPADMPDEAVAVIYRGGISEAPDRWAEPRVQLLVRAPSQDRCLALWQDLRGIFAAQWGILLSSGAVVSSVPSTPQAAQQTMWGASEVSSGFIGFDAKGRYEFSANYRLVVEHLI